ncbi:unnamed protein product [Protopolystoma xenopodis]|uniref:Uncharacterized protein n=1 Tax=Protopolystoma xenopodis TaxID=117903 RepID=A0A3S5A4P3_9PLAT|nr:unnamed protein product [Protopolystoma xenopodis]
MIFCSNDARHKPSSCLSDSKKIASEATSSRMFRDHTTSGLLNHHIISRAASWRKPLLVDPPNYNSNSPGAVSTVFLPPQLPPRRRAQACAAAATATVTSVGSATPDLFLRQISGQLSPGSQARHAEDASLSLPSTTMASSIDSPSIAEAQVKHVLSLSGGSVGPNCYSKGPITAENISSFFAFNNGTKRSISSRHVASDDLVDSPPTSHVCTSVGNQIQQTASKETDRPINHTTSKVAESSLVTTPLSASLLGHQRQQLIAFLQPTSVVSATKASQYAAPSVASTSSSSLSSKSTPSADAILHGIRPREKAAAGGAATDKGELSSPPSPPIPLPRRTLVHGKAVFGCDRPAELARRTVEELTRRQKQVSRG